MKNATLKEDLAMITGASLPWDRLANKSILVTGANGFLPAYMIETLLYLNDTKGLNIQIIGLVRNKEKATLRFKQYLTRSNLQFVVQDVIEPFKNEKKIDFIIHAASQSSPKYYGTDPVGTLSANILGTHHLLELAKRQKSEDFFYFSSGEIYGEVNEANLPVNENHYGRIDPLNLRSCYAESKRMGENMCISYANQFDLSVKIVRPFHVYGPGLKLDDQRVFSDFVADIVHQRDIKVRGDGSAVRAFCYLADATLGFFTVLLKGKKSEAYNIGNPACSLSVLELANRLAALFPEKKLKVLAENKLSSQGYIVSSINKIYPDISKINALGWQPTTTIEQGFKKTVGSFNESA